MAYEKIRTSITGGVAIVTMADPSTMNAASNALVEELRHAFDALAKADSGARCLVLTGEGRGFCSGANLNLDAGRSMSDAGDALRAIHNPFVSQMRDYPLPIVTAVNGPAAGIGCSFALMGDLVVAAESAFFVEAFRRIGLVPDGGATFLLSRLVGKARAMELALLGERLPARTALDWGLINRCVPDAELMPTAMALAASLANGPKSLGYMRKLIWDGMESRWADQLDAEADAQTLAGQSEDCAEGVAAFREKREPVFSGR